MKPAGSERNMAANIDALRQNASRARRKRGDIPGDGSCTGALSDAAGPANRRAHRAHRSRGDGARAARGQQ